MQINPEDIYRVINDSDLSQRDIDILLTLYQPLIGGDSILVYFMLSAEGNSNRTSASHAHLFNMMNSITADVFLRARMRLEAYGLLKTYVKKSHEENAYVYVLNPPLHGDEFFESAYAKEYLKIMGKKALNDSVNRFGMHYEHWSEYKDITTQATVHESQRPDYSVDYQTIKPKLSFTNDDSDIMFDYNRFIAITSSLVFPIELRTQENMSFIGRLATVHGISADQMKLFVSKCCNLDSLQLNRDKLRVLCEKAQPDHAKEKDVYKLPPVSFLQSKQNGAAVSLNDKRILEHLSLDMHFNNEVINIMIEYILKISDNRLNEKFVYMVAGEWARDGVCDRKTALEECKKDLKYKSSKKGVSVSVPEYMLKQDQGNIQKSKKANDDLIRDIQNDMKNMGGN